LIRVRFVRTLFHKELLRFLANPALWILILLFFLIGILVSVSDVILQRDTYNIVSEEGEPSGFLRFVAGNEPNIRVFGPGEIGSRQGLTRLVLVRQGSDSPDIEPGTGDLPSLEISSPELSREDLSRLRDLLVKNAFLYLGVRPPLDIRITSASPGASLPGPEIAMGPAKSPEDFKKLIMALLITISLNIINFNLFTVSFTEEKQNRTLLAVLLSPARSSEVAAAKALFFLLPGLALPASMAGFYRPDVLAQPVFWATLVAGALLYMSMALVLVSFVQKQSTANLICLGYLFFLSSMFILAPRFTALYPIKNHLPENFIFSILSFLFDGTRFASYASFFWSFLAVAVAAPFAAMAVFTRRMGSRPPETEPRQRQWTLGDCGLIFALCLFFHFVISPMIFRLFRSMPMLPQNRLAGYLLLYLMVFALPLALILPVYTRFKFRAPLTQTFLRSEAPGRDLLTGAIWFVLYLAGLLSAGWVLFSACMPQVSPETLGELKALAPHQLHFFRNVLGMLRRLGPGSVVLFLFVLGVAVPILEELFFRGCLLSALQNRWGPRVALVGSAVCFGVAHMNPVLFPLYFLLGILTGRLAQKRGGLLAPMMFHSLNNLASLAVILLVF
jgi:membrane protease YdiL (CAAX protease family)